MTLLSRLSLVHRVLLGLILVQAAVLVADHLPGREFELARPPTGARLLPEISADRVSGLALTGGGRATEVLRRGEQWVVGNEGGAAADGYFVRTALESLAKLAPGPVVSENPARHEAYEVAGRYALEVEVRGDDEAPLARFVVGRSTPDGRGFYLRYPADSDLVMLVQPNVRDAFLRGGNARGAWRDKTVFAFDSRRIREFELWRPDAPEQGVRIRRETAEGAAPTDKDEWAMILPAEARLRPEVGNAMATGFADLKAEAFAESSAADAGLDPPRVRVTARLDDGAEFVLEIGAEEGNLLYARKPGQPEICRIHTFRLHNFLKTSAELGGR